MEEKVCFKCGKKKPLSEFYEHSQMADGHLNKCKECTKRERRIYEAENADSVLSTRLSMCMKNPSQYNARKAVEAAINAGAIEKQGYCSGCGISEHETRISTHHHDYTKPLDVIWLCAKCHRQVDANRRIREGKTPYGQSRGVFLVYDGKKVCRFDTIADAARSVDRKPNAISSCLAGKHKKCAGFEWEYEAVQDA